MNNQWFSKVAVWLVIALVLFTVFKQFDRAGQPGSADRLLRLPRRGARQAYQGRHLQEGNGGTEILAVTNDDKRIRSTATYLDRGLVGDLIANNVKFDVKPREEPSLLMSILISWGPMLLLIGVWIYFMRQMQGGGKGGAFSFGKSEARMLDESNNPITFADVAGCDEAKEEVKELVDFLKDPQKFQKLGGRIPRGVLMVGPSGHRQDAAGQGDRRRSQGAVLLDLRLRLRRDVRRRRRGARARHVRAGQEERAVHHLRRRNRRASAATAAPAWAAATTSASRR